MAMLEEVTPCGNSGRSILCPPLTLLVTTPPRCQERMPVGADGVGSKTSGHHPACPSPPDGDAQSVGSTSAQGTVSSTSTPPWHKSRQQKPPPPTRNPLLKEESLYKGDPSTHPPPPPKKKMCKVAPPFPTKNNCQEAPQQKSAPPSKEKKCAK